MWHIIHPVSLVWYISVFVCIFNRVLRDSLAPQASLESLVLLWVNTLLHRALHILQNMSISPAACEHCSSAVVACRVQWDLAVLPVLLERTERMWVFFFLTPVTSESDEPNSNKAIPSYLSSALPQGEAGKAGRPGERGAAGPQVRTHAFLTDTHRYIADIVHLWSVILEYEKTWCLLTEMRTY